MSNVNPQMSYYNPRIEKMSREELERLQLKKLLYQIRYVYENTRFYRNLCQKHGVHPDDIKTKEDYFEKWPTISKADLVKDQVENPPWGTRVAVPIEKVVQTHITSGTSGLGQEVYANTAADVELMGTNWMNLMYWAGIRKGDTVSSTWPVATMAGGLSGLQAFVKFGANPFHIQMYDSTSKLKTYMMRFKPNLFVAVPTYLTRITVLAEEMGIVPTRDFPGLKAIVTGTEPYPIAWAERMESIWGATLAEGYGSTQHGSCMAAVCEYGVVPGGKRGVLHFMEQHSLVEVLDPATGRQVEYGDTGEVVITTLDREGSPLMRFRMGDRATFVSHKSCPCGRPYNGVEAGTLSRYDDMIKMKMTNVWPQAIDETIFAYDEADEYNGRVFVDDKGREQVEVKLEFKKQVSSAETKAALLKKIAEELKRNTGVTMIVQEVPYGTVERYDYKVRRWTDERQKGLERMKYLDKK